MVYNKHYRCHTADLFKMARVTRIDFQLLKCSLELIFYKHRNLIPEEISQMLQSFDHTFQTRKPRKKVRILFGWIAFFSHCKAIWIQDAS